MFNLQDFHFGQVPEGSVSQFADAVPLQFQHLQTGQTLEGQALDLKDPVPVQLPAGWTDRHGTSSTSHTVNILNHRNNLELGD